MTISPSRLISASCHNSSVQGEAWDEEEDATNDLISERSVDQLGCPGSRTVEPKSESELGGVEGHAVGSVARRRLE